MNTLQNLVSRGESDNGLNPTITNLLIALLVLILLGLSLIAVLLVVRRKRRASKEPVLPLHNDQCTHSSHHRRLTISTTPYHSRKKESVYVIDEKRNLVENSSSPPSDSVPEIRITFPEEEDASGKRKSGRVVVVRIGEKGGVGLEPCDDESLPPYQTNGTERFHSLDIERMGGLKEKEDEKRWG